MEDRRKSLEKGSEKNTPNAYGKWLDVVSGRDEGDNKL